ncbi:MAG: sulfite exporter TauE/SafE family protein, partial [Candidatus Puniceispirillaceae bacterium]
MSPELFIYLMLAGLAGGFINGLAGFGTALFSLGFLLQILPPVQAVGLVLILSVFSGLQGLWIVRQQIFEHPKRLVRFLLPALIGIPLGVYSLSFIDTDLLKIFIGLFMLFYGG